MPEHGESKADGDIPMLLAAMSGVEFDLVMFSEHADDDEQGEHVPLFCPRLVLHGDGSREVWPQRWQPVFPDMVAWALGEHPWIDNLRLMGERIAREAGVPIGDLPGVRELRNRDIQSLLCFCIQVGEQLAASLVIGSKRESCYGEPEYQRLIEQNIEDSLRALLGARQARREALIRQMRFCFSPKLYPDELARELTQRLCAELEWDYVGVYRVETQFALVDECDGTGQGLKVGKDYRQDLDKGFLGNTLNAGVCLRADDVAVTPPPYDYIPLDGLPARSALCYPIKVGGQIEWLLDCESIAVAAFRGPDREMLDRIIEGLQSVLDLWFEYRLGNAVLDGLAQPVLVAGRDGTIQRANQQAQILLGHADSIIGKTPADYAFDETSRQLVSPLRDLHAEPIKMRAATGQAAIMRATVRLSDRIFGRWLLQFTDAEEQRALTDLDYVRSTLEQVASQARGPLMLATTLIRRLLATKGDGEPSEGLVEALRRVEENIAKADISYERLARAVSGKEEISVRSLLGRVRAVLPLQVRLNFDNVPEAAVHCDGPAVSAALAAVLRRQGTAAGGSAFDISGNVRGNHVLIDVKYAPDQLRFSPAWALAIGNLFSRSTTQSPPATGFTGTSEPILSDLDRLRWAVATDGGNVSATTTGLEVQLLRAASPGSQEV
jgi:putative methionine-R-sulfoxide reductase with GAF domain